MKILALRFTNLNSLRGSFAIDFTLPPLSETGLFAITGPTGSGKTTVLDAITLALYGRAARYGADANPEQVISKHTGSCSAEVEFVCGTGRFRSSWSLRRARNKPDGKLQSAERKVIATKDEVVLTQKIDDSNRKVEELTGLNYERFLRSVMLAQGEFAAFLKAKPNERTELLEQITGTEVYSEISKAAYRHSEAARLAHDTLLNRLQTLNVFSNEARLERETLLVSTRVSAAELQSMLDRLDIRLADARTFLQCTAEEGAIKIEEARIQKEREAWADYFDALEKHERAAVFALRLNELDQFLTLQEADTRKVTLLRSELPQLARLQGETTAVLIEARKALGVAEAEEEMLKPLWMEIAQLDADLEHSRKTRSQLEERRKGVETAHAVLLKEIEAATEAMASNEARLALLAEWQKNHAADEAIPAALTGMHLALARWKEESRQLTLFCSESKELERKLAGLDAEIVLSKPVAVALGKEVESCEAARERLREELGALLAGRSFAEWESDRDGIQQRLGQLERLKKTAVEIGTLAGRRLLLGEELGKLAAEFEMIAVKLSAQERHLEEGTKLLEERRKSLRLIELVQSLEKHRHALKDGEPCPLCGALEHPQGTIGLTPATEIAAAANALSEAETALAITRRILAELGKKHAALQAERNRAEAESNRTALDVAALEAVWHERAGALGLGLQPAEAADLDGLVHSEVRRGIALKERVENARTLENGSYEAEKAVSKAAALYREKQGGIEKMELLAMQMRERLAMVRQKQEATVAAQLEAEGCFNDAIKPFDEQAKNPAAGDSLLDRLARRGEEFAQKTQAAVDLQTSIRTASATILELRRQADGSLERLAAERTKEGDERTKAGAFEVRRREKFGEKSLVSDQQRVAVALKSARNAVEDASERGARARGKLELCERQIQELAQSIEERAGRIMERRETLANEIATAGFETLEVLRHALLPEVRVTELKQRRNQLDAGIHKLDGRRVANETIRARLPAETLSDSSILETLAAEKHSGETARQEVEQRIGVLREELRVDEERRIHSIAIMVEIDQAAAEFRRWAALSALIGSANGSLFSRFAQGLTLERLVGLANRHLRHLNPRYTLQRSVEEFEALELEIVDTYQAGISRPMKSLSGGESFLASLALALGLSELASGQTTIESLFIDEGFGTLDAETLEIAMDGLGNLQARGKIIGVISHVELMKERITTQIQVRKLDGGCSQLEIVA